MKFANADIWKFVTVPSFPTSPSKATMKFLKALTSSHGAFVLFATAYPGSLHGSVPKKPSARSPRQCMAPWEDSPFKVCVVIGPFIG